MERRSGGGGAGLRRSTRLLLSTLALILPLLILVRIARAETAKVSLWSGEDPNLLLLAALFATFAAMAGFVALMFRDVLNAQVDDQDS